MAPSFSAPGTALPAAADRFRPSERRDIRSKSLSILNAFYFARSVEDTVSLIVPIIIWDTWWDLHLLNNISKRLRWVFLACLKVPFQPRYLKELPCQLVGNVSTSTRCIAVKFQPDLHGSQSMNPCDSNDPRTYYVAQSSSSPFWFMTKYLHNDRHSHHLQSMKLCISKENLTRTKNGKN